ncbi:MAG: RAMP superfamily CRISPR-associated protein [Nostoc sp. DedQUE04]|uniref:RAMP superfamily CRISPR-associated protein n=1 Tax=Nostoc sp. DedQUE04 TaxID=3075390 RepID=UPI002AD50511|nr:RAMP superfamily CRISPR-associated protein [Nostoc sp. DedQUE04]MDZ8139558.1 RAMP superfamily CRISPR-associated protein [Nostoc sp. DedQUE04]
MSDFRTGYLYTLAPIHCGGEGDLGNILDIVREVHTDFPYIPGSSLRGSLRWDINSIDSAAADKLFGRELSANGQMGVHQVWFGDARLLWVPMRTMAMNGNRNVFTWVSCHSLIRDHALLSGLPISDFPDHPVGTQMGSYYVADAQLQVSALTESQKQAIALAGDWQRSLADAVEPIWNNNRVVLADSDFQTLMEHSLWTQIRNKINEIDDEDDEDDSEGGAEIFWTDVCIPRDTILYYPWGYKLNKTNSVAQQEHDLLMNVVTGLFQIGGQANVGRGWVQGWVTNSTLPILKTNQSIPVEA